MKMNFRKAGAFVVLALSLAVSTAKADVVTDRNQTAIKIVSENQPGRLFAVRNLAIVHLAVHDAVNSAKLRYEVYVAKVTAPDNASPEAAALSAAYNTLVALYPIQKPALDAAYAKDVGKLPTDASRESGLKIGEAVSEQILPARKDDGAAAKVEYQLGDRPTTCKPTAPSKAPALQRQFAKLKPFFVRDAFQFDPGKPYDGSSPEFGKGLDEVKRIGGRNSAERTGHHHPIIFSTR